MSPSLEATMSRWSRGPARAGLLCSIIGLFIWTTRFTQDPTDLNLTATTSRGDYSNVRVGVYEGSGFHDDVAGALIYAAELTGAQVTSYRSWWRFGYQDVLKGFHDKPTVTVGTGDQKGGLEHTLRAGKLDVMILASCDQRWLSDGLRSALADSSAVQVICLHHEGHLFHQHRGHFGKIAAQGRLQYISLGTHTTGAYARELSEWAVADQQPGWAIHPVQTFVAHFPVPSAHAAGRKPGRADRVAIMGDLDRGRRHFDRIFDDLTKSIDADPTSWGYRLTDQLTLEPIDPAKAFQLHILGSDKGTVDIPSRLNATVIHLHSGTSYEEYYKVLDDMDLVIPAWHNKEYTANRASASICVAINARIPTLLHPIIIDSYPYLDPLAYVMHVAGESEIEQVLEIRKGLRSSSSSPETNSASRPFWQADIRKDQSWPRYHDRLRAWNVQILTDVYNRVDHKQMGRTM